MTTGPYGKKPADSAASEQRTTAEGGKNEAENSGHSTPAEKTVRRQMTLKRKLTYALLKPVLVLIVNFIWLSCRVKVTGQETMDKVIAEHRPVIPCYWHQQHLFCGWYMLQQIKRGMKVGFLVSPSVDGEIPAKIVSSRGATVIRGSSTRTGAQALRDMYQIIVRDGVSPVTTSDGPTGPIFKFKPGAAMLSQMTAAPMLPIACAAKNAWYLKSWDRFMIPRPFTRVVVAVGETVSVSAGQSNKDLTAVQQQMEQAINAMMQRAENSL